MATSNRAALQVIQSQLLAGGYVKRAVIGDVKAPVDTLTAAVYSMQITIPETTPVAPRMSWTTNIRLYARTLDGREEETELLMDEVVQKIIEDVCGDFTLGGEVAYLLPTELVVRFGYLELGGVWFRVADIPVVYRIDDRAAYTA